MTPITDKEISIRPVTTIAELKVVEDLQRDVWVVPDIEIVPYSQLIAVVTAGGVLLGAFDGAEMVGFAYGFVGYENGQITHHSHMLAVRPEYRNYKLGEKLKRAQRDFVLSQGISLMSWTFDPLQSLNAYFNFNKLGVTSDTYYVDFYGADAPSFLHRNSTDRLWVMWNLRDERENRETDFSEIERLVRLDKDDAPATFEPDENESRLAIEIPTNINRLQEEDIELAGRWREATRQAFLRAFDNGYTAAGFYRKTRDGQDYGVYLLERKSR